MTPALRKAGIGLEVAASALNATAHRCDAGQSSVVDFERAMESHDLARAGYRAALEATTGESAAAIERWLAL